MALSIDFHIHSALSPCADNDMTPNNIINMAILKNLDVIAVTDHNCAFNIPALQKAANSYGIAFVPGIEVQTKEEVHILCYFKDYINAFNFGKIIYDLLPDIKNNENLFGNQYIMDENDNITGSLEKLLLSSANITLNSLVKLTKEYAGVCVPAHVDRASYSIITNLGFIPFNLNINTIEVSKNCNTNFIQKNNSLNKYKIIRSSDAHYLYDILEAESFIDIDNFSLSSIINYIG